MAYWPLPIGAFQDQCKQIVINKHNYVKDPGWQEADQLATTETGRLFFRRRTKQSLLSRNVFELSPRALQLRPNR